MGKRAAPLYSRANALRVSQTRENLLVWQKQLWLFI
ncbi:hypothetical protein PhaeoP97_01853 [Phaeobacter porticola]|uniref:Uncharacterized protein n=1 Tax=Phaeobacter porticola TaxID=1844006 RepID=A0A1L3I575_9RHOB|nr:hypothetical protein PhaeoP97_01853 [Phaeobacter porticola]